jgi:kynurenine formamidase
MTFDDTGVNFKIWHLHEHIGTHIDAPIHFSADGQGSDEIPIGQLVVPLAVIDIRARAAADPDAELTPDDVRAWQGQHGPLPFGCCVAVNSGWDAMVPGSGYRNADEAGIMHFPGVHVEAAHMLMEDCDVAGLAVDTLSFDHGPTTDHPTHKAWLPSGRWAVEGLAKLDSVPRTGATLVVGAPTIVGSTGGPCRILALVDEAALH